MNLSSLPSRFFLWLPLLLAMIGGCTTTSNSLLNEDQILSSNEFQEWCQASRVVRSQEGFVSSNDLFSPSMTKSEALEILDRHSAYLTAQHSLNLLFKEKQITRDSFYHLSDSLIANSGLPEGAQTKLRYAIPFHPDRMHLLNEYQAKLERLYLAFPELVPQGMAKLEELFAKCNEVSTLN